MPSVEPAFDRLGHRVEQLVDQCARSSRVNVASTKSARSSSSGGQRPDADPEPGVVLPLQRALDALEAVVAAGGAGPAQAEPARPAGPRRPPGSSRSSAGVELRQRAERRQSGAAPVHVRLRLEQLHRACPSRCPAASRARSPRRKRAEPPARARWSARRNPALCRVSVVLRAGVPQPHDGAQSSGLRLRLRPRPRPRPSASG